LIKIVGIQFKPNGKIYDFDPVDLTLEIGDHVIVETEQGPGYGIVVTNIKDIEKIENDRELKKVTQIANEEDLLKKEESKKLEKEAFGFCLEAIEELDLEMNLFSVESSFDSSKLTFFFTADGRIDFRELVKILVRNYKVKIEMRQVGVRNQAKMWGGIGRCGREICCSCFLKNFDPVSIRMAKEQNLSLNPTKISGLCGRLMCCLTYEYETYKELRRNFPRIGEMVQTKTGPANVIRINVVGSKVTVKYESGLEMDVKLADIKW